MDIDITVNTILTIFCPSFKEQVAHRVYFYKSSRLLRHGLIKIHRGRWHQGGDLVDQGVELDRRVLDDVVGLDTEVNELVEGSDLYTPDERHDISKLVLPQAHKEELLQTVTNYTALVEYRKRTREQQTAATIGRRRLLSRKIRSITCTTAADALRAFRAPVHARGDRTAR